MAIATTNGKLAIMELDQDYEPGFPISPGALGQDDKQQLLWGFPEILWEEQVIVDRRRRDTDADYIRRRPLPTPTILRTVQEQTKDLVCQIRGAIHLEPLKLGQVKVEIESGEVRQDVEILLRSPVKLTMPLETKVLHEMLTEAIMEDDSFVLYSELLFGWFKR